MDLIQFDDGGFPEVQVPLKKLMEDCAERLLGGEETLESAADGFISPAERLLGGEETLESAADGFIGPAERLLGGEETLESAADGFSRVVSEVVVVSESVCK